VHKDLIAKAEDLTRGKPVFTSSMRIKGFRTLDDTEILSNSMVQPSAAFCGVGNPESFFRQLELHGSVLAMTKAFSDHHNYTQADLDFLSEQAIAAGARTLFTTKKDGVKLRTLRISLPTYVLEIEIAIENAAKFLSLIREVVSSRGPMGALAAE
jgi:tetraacyldisaccharide-1-P 4'-kinase